jgi:hypothetical protein
MGLNAELTAVKENFFTNGPKPIVDTIKGSVADLKDVFDPSSYYSLLPSIETLSKVKDVC